MNDQSHIQVAASLHPADERLTKDALVALAKDYAAHCFSDGRSAIEGPLVLSDAPLAAGRLNKDFPDMLMTFAIPTPLYESDNIEGFMRKMLASIGATKYAVVCEAWLAQVDPQANPELMKVAPSKREDRREAAVVYVVDADGASITMSEIIRAPDEAPRLGEFETPKGMDGVGGRFTTWLDAEAA